MWNLFLFVSVPYKGWIASADFRIIRVRAKYPYCHVKLTLLPCKIGTIAFCLTTFNRLFLLLSSIFSYFACLLKMVKGFVPAGVGSSGCAFVPSEDKIREEQENRKNKSKPLRL